MTSKLNQARPQAQDNRQTMPNPKIEFSLLAVLALLWGSSYLFMKVAVSEIPPVTLIGIRVLVASIFLLMIMLLRKEQLPRDAHSWRLLFVNTLIFTVGAWCILAWGQQYVDASLASVLNSTSPIFTFLITSVMARHGGTNLRKFSGVLLGFAGVILIIGVDALKGIGQQTAGQLACLVGASLYACAAIYGRRLKHLSALSAATGTMLTGAIILVPAALLIDSPWLLTPSPKAILAALALAILSSSVALLVYFRLIKTLGSLGVTSQAYLRAGVGVLLGVVFLGETITLLVGAGLLLAIGGVVLINWPTRPG